MEKLLMALLIALGIICCVGAVSAIVDAYFRPLEKCCMCIHEEVENDVKVE